jgi:Gpi18-like mannosyltransferase
MKRWAPAVLVAVALLCGLVIRFALNAHVSGDASVYILPWYAFVRAHGAASLRFPFTNYPPYYTYVLLGLTRLEGLASPLTLIKAVSAIFELACAAMAARIVALTGAGRRAGALAFSVVWLAPTVLLNGPYWAQADSIWTFFVLVSLRLFMQGRNGVPAFALAFAVKLQCIFFGPFMLGMILKRRALWPWLATVPAVYIVLALPILIAGRPLGSVLSIYLDQANTYHLLSLNAANLWIFGPANETLGTMIGLISAAMAGLFVAVLTARIPDGEHERLLVGACASLLIMPFLLPKMHDRYFYAFEIASIALAFANPRYIGLAVIAQADGILSYMMFDARLPLATLAPAAACNAGMAVMLVEQMIRPTRSRRPSLAPLAAFAVAAVVMLGLLTILPRPRALVWFPLFAALFSLAGAILLLSMRRGEPAARTGIPRALADNPGRAGG